MLKIFEANILLKNYNLFETIVPPCRIKGEIL